MATLKSMKAKLEKLYRQEQKTRETIKQTIEEMHSSCPHDRFIEGDYRAGEFFGSDPPFRVCTDCGYAEEGWGCGYEKLGKRVYSGVPRLNRDEAFKLVTGRIFRNEELRSRC